MIPGSKATHPTRASWRSRIRRQPRVVPSWTTTKSGQMVFAVFPAEGRKYVEVKTVAWNFCSFQVPPRVASHPSSMTWRHMFSQLSLYQFENHSVSHSECQLRTDASKQVPPFSRRKRLCSHTFRCRPPQVRQICRHFQLTHAPCFSQGPPAFQCVVE